MKYRKKPVIVEAIQLQIGEKSMAAVQAFTDGGARPATEGSMHIPTLEGTMRANIGDWIVKGINGEFYPVKPEIFAATCEPE